MTKKIISLIIIIICISINLFYYEIYAVPTIDSSTVMTTIIDPDDYKPGSEDNANNADKLKDIGNTIIGFLQIIGSILSVVVLVVLGIKYMMGSAEEKAEYKKTLTPYVIGAVMVFAITNILSIIADVSKSLL